MKSNPMAFAILAVAAGLFGVNSVGAFEAQPELDSLQLNAVESGFAGHVTAIHADEDGNILSYMQTDNVVTDEGIDCASEILFMKASTGSLGCPIVWSSQTAEDTTFDAIQLFEGATPDAESTAAVPDGTVISALDLTIVNATLVTGNLAADNGAANQVTFTHTFTAGSGVSGEVIDGAMLMLDDSVSDGLAMFAASTFTQVVMDDSDTLLVTWIIDLT